MPAPTVYELANAPPPKDVQQQIEALLRAKLRYDDAPAAREFLRQVVDGVEPADVKTRVRAAETLLKVGGFVAPRPDAAGDRDKKDLSRMTRSELNDVLDRARAELAVRATPVIDAQVDAPQAAQDVDSLG